MPRGSLDLRAATIELLDERGISDSFETLDLSCSKHNTFLPNIRSQSLYDQ